jgi:hypothetical protein
MPESPTDPTRAPSPDPVRFVAYVYPGWHADPYRPGIDEWSLMDGYLQRYPQQEAPPRPLDGPYRDDTPEAARRQADLAVDAGISAFTYFSYFKPDVGFVMDAPMRRMLDATEAEGGPTVGGTWCIRLPHDHFPVAPSDHMELPDIPEFDADTPLEQRPIEALSLDDLEVILGADDALWEARAFDGTSGPRVRRSPSIDASGPDTVNRPPVEGSTRA